MKTKILTILIIIVLLGTIFTNYLSAETYSDNLVEKNNMPRSTIQSNSSYDYDELLSTVQLIQETNNGSNEKLLINKVSSHLFSEKKTEVKKELENKKELEKKAEKKTSISLNEEDKKALLKIVEAEATGEDIKGRVLVANVIFNRVNSDRFPSTVYDVIHQKIKGKAQFSPIDDGRYHTIKVSQKTIKAVELALAGEDYSNGALFFVAPSMASKKSLEWFEKKLVKVMEHGVHEFYKY